MQKSPATGIFTVREVTESDLNNLLTLIEAFADYEGESDVSLTTEGLKTCLFEEKCGRALLACIDGRPVGFATFSIMFVTYQSGKSFLIDSLYLQGDVRGRGYGKKLMRHIAEIAQAEGAVYLEWAAYTWNKSACQFYDGIGAKRLDWDMFRLSGEALTKLVSG